MIYWPTKPVTAVRQYGLDYGPLLSKLGGLSVVESVWEKLRGPAVIATGSIDPDGQRVYTQVSGGGADQTTIFRNTVTLSDGRVEPIDVYMKTRA